MPRWIAILIVLFFFQNDALANDAELCAAGNGIYLSGVVTTLPVFSHGRVLQGVELSHTHISMKAGQDGRTYDVAMDNLFAQGYDQQRNGVPPPLDQLHIGDRISLCGALYTSGIGMHWVHSNCGRTPTTQAPNGWVKIIASDGTESQNLEASTKYCSLFYR